MKVQQPMHTLQTISRPNDLEWLIKVLPQKLSDTDDCLYMFGNRRGYGKSALVKEMAYKRDEICRRNKVPSGPVLFTDFTGVKDATGAERKILETIRPLFISSVNLSSVEGSLCSISFFIDVSRDFLFLLFHIFCYRRAIA